MTGTVSQSPAGVNVQALLTAAGFHNFRGNRCDCPQCTGHSRLTVAIDRNKGLYHCHRCHCGGGVRRLARAQGLALPELHIGLAKKRRLEFEKWLSERQTEMARTERRLASRAVLAQIALADFPLMGSAWKALARWYDSRRDFERFWEACSDKIGRYWLYRAWRAVR